VENPLYRLCTELAAAGRLPASAFGARAREDLSELLRADIISRVRSGAGWSFVVSKPDVFSDWIGVKFAHLQSEYFATTAGAANLLRSRNTKAGGRRGQTHGLLVRAQTNRQVRIGDREDELTKIAAWGDGVAGFRLSTDNLHHLSIEGPLLLIENPEVFWNWEIGFPAYDWTLVLKGGVATTLIIDWLRGPAMSSSQVTLVVDYDPTGLGEYERFVSALGTGRTSLFMHDDLDRLFELFSNEELLTRKKSVTLLTALRDSVDPSTRRTIKLMDDYKAGLEHEAILLGKNTAVG
jgi:hypothetical protein